MKTKTILALCIAVAVLAVGAVLASPSVLQSPVFASLACLGLALATLRYVTPRFIPVTNTIESMIGMVGDTMTRSAEAAFASKYLLGTEGTAVRQVNVCGVANIPLGPVFIEGSDAAIAASDEVTVHRLASGVPCLVVASEAITRGEAVYTAANGKVQDLPATTTAALYHIGYALTAAGADGDLILISPCSPVLTAVA